ncbi:MAG TPA: hypothetical protein VK528_00915 [Flavobacterium sp.]|nr:hypothetical protein [Flavobacterium sp.]
MKKIFLPCFASLILCSCITIKGDFKGLYGYYDKTNKDFPGLLVKPSLETPLCNITKTETPRIIVANGTQIKACLEQYDNSVLFIWSSKCHGIYCYALNAVQRECKAKGIELFVAAEYYDGESMIQDYNIDRPIFGIDTEYYNTSLTDKYMKAFFWDITGKEERNMKFIQFKNGQFERMCMRLEDL